MGKKNLEITSIRLAFSMGNFFFAGVFGAELAPFAPFAPLAPLTPFAFLHLEVSSVTVDVGKKE